MPGPYFIKDGYRHRAEPHYADDADHAGVVWQPDVYPEAARLAELLGADHILDVGCGSGAKLAVLHPAFALVAIDLPGPNLELCRSRHPFVDCRPHDFDSDVALPVADVVLARAAVVCSDVIEHLRRPERLLRALRSALDMARVVVLSTPERDLTWGPDHNGPPPNPCHVREWSMPELDAFLDDMGFRHRSLTLTRSNDSTNERKTILCRLFDEEAALEAASSPVGDTEPGGTAGRGR